MSEEEDALAGNSTTNAPAPRVKIERKKNKKDDKNDDKDDNKKKDEKNADKED